MKTISKIFLAIAVVFLAVSCKSTQSVPNTSMNVDFEIQNLGKTENNSQRLRVVTSSNDKASAIEKAKIDALREMLFVGIFEDGKCVIAAICPDPVVRDTRREYFAELFGNSYKDYVELDGNGNPELLAKAQGQETYGVTVLVNTSKLRKKLAADDILK